MSVKKIRTADLKVGMKIHKIDRSWLFSPFKAKDYVLTNREEIQKLIKYNIDEVYVYSDSGYLGEIAPAPEGNGVLSLIDTFEALVADFQLGSEMPVSIYFKKEDETLSPLLAKGVTFSDEAYDLIKSVGIDAVRIPNGQRPEFESYKKSLGEKRAKLAEDGFSGEYLNPAAVERHYNFMDDYFPINHLALEPGSCAGFDIYTKRDVEVKKVWDRDKQLEADILAIWKEINEYLVIRKEDRQAYRSYLMIHTKNWKNRWARAAFVRENSRMILEELASEPRSKKLMAAAKDSVVDMTRMVLDNPTTFYALMRINNHDYYTFTHSVNVSTLSLALAIALGNKKASDLADLGLGAMLHDLGKSFVDSRLINKPGRYTEKEFNIVVNHVELGYNALKGSDLVSEQALIPIAQHHEKLSGSGYPRGLKGDDIHPFGRLSAIIDIYDALTTERPYRKALNPFDALNLISMSHEDFDRGIFTTFVSLLHNQEVDNASDLP